MYDNIPLQKISIEDVSIGLRQVGFGDDLVFIHGFPTHGATWRKVLPELSKKYRCHILDLPGLGSSDWSNKSDFSSKSQGSYVVKLLELLKIKNYSIIAHDSGATIARSIALGQGENVHKLIMMNTEIPNHRPPWIPLYQKIGLLPSVPRIIRSLLRQSWFLKSSMGFKELYSDKSMLYEHIQVYTNPLIKSAFHTKGAFKYLKGIDWKLVDEFAHQHKKIKARVLFIWGEDDKTFPIKLGKEMMSQFSGYVKFVTIRNSSLLPHEEKPQEVVDAILKFS